MNEIWKPIQEYEGLYEISNTGKVKSLRKNRLLIPWKQSKGYLSIVLTKDKKPKTFYIHRLVASAFLENEKPSMAVNHIDGNKQNNCVDNLEWCSDAENRKHAYENGLREMEEMVEVEMISVHGKYMGKFPSISEASRKTGINIGNISSCCNGERPTAGGYIFRKAEVQNG